MKTINTVVVKSGDYRRFLMRLLKAFNFEGKIAADAAQAIEAADRFGVHSHGILGFSRVMPACDATNGVNSPALVLKGQSSIWDAAGVPGPTAIEQPIKRAVAQAKRYGISTAIIRNAGHIIFPVALYAAAKESRMIINWYSTSPTTAASYTGGTAPTLGTNVVNWLFPVGGDLDVVWIDQAMTGTSLGAVALARKSNSRIQCGLVRDERGNPTSDPKRAKMLEPFGGNKGANLSLAAELLSCFVGGRGKGDRFVTAVLTVIDPRWLDSGSEIGPSQSDRVARFIQTLRHNDKVRLPGQRRLEISRFAAKAGGIIFPVLYAASLKAAAKSAGVNLHLRKLKLPARLIKEC